MENLQLDFIICCLPFHFSFHAQLFWFACEWRWSVTKSLNVSNYCQYQYLFVWFIEMHHLVPIICSSFLFHRPGHISIRADTKSPVTCYYNIGGGRNEPWHVFWTRQAGVFKYIPTAQSPFTLNVTSIIVTDSHNYSPHLWLMICISICICSRHWVGANYMSHIVLKEPN